MDKINCLLEEALRLSACYNSLHKTYAILSQHKTAACKDYIEEIPLWEIHSAIGCGSLTFCIDCD